MNRSRQPNTTLPGGVLVTCLVLASSPLHAQQNEPGSTHGPSITGNGMYYGNTPDGHPCYGSGYSVGPGVVYPPGPGLPHRYGGPATGEGYGYSQTWGPRYGWGNGPNATNRSSSWRPMMGQFIDTNNDGIISDEEAATRHEETFFTFDSNHDHQMSLDEYMSMQTGVGMGVWHEQRQAEKLKRFELLDSDSDGIVSQPEFMQSGQQWFLDSDRDGDGKVTIWEFRAQRRTWQ